nr:hypothetical protein [Tanacetum cinerariifolium]
LALQSYLDALLQDATEDLPEVLPAEPQFSAEDDFEAAVREEQEHDKRMQALVTPVAVAVAAPAPVAVPVAVAAPVVVPVA